MVIYEFIVLSFVCENVNFEYSNTSTKNDLYLFNAPAWLIALGSPITFPTTTNVTKKFL